MSEGGIALLLLAASFGILAGLETLGIRKRGRPQEDTPGRMITNFGLALLVMLASSVPPLYRIGASSIAEAYEFGLAHTFAMRWPLSFAVTLLAQSMTAYWVHRASHAVPLLWRVHRVHHSDELLDVSTGLRNHPLELLVALPTSVTLVLLLGTPTNVVVAVDAVLFVAALWQHADLRLPHGLDRSLSKVIVTPGLHRVHHAPDRAIHDHNYGDILIVWDRLFGTFAVAPQLSCRVGLDNQRARPDNLMEQLLSPLHVLQLPDTAEKSA